MYRWITPPETTRSVVRVLPRSRDTSQYFLLMCILLVGLVTSQTVCPPECACHGVTVDCRFRSLTDVADIAHLLPPEVEDLDLGDNPAILAVNRTAFPLLTGLRRLRLDGCRRVQKMQ